MCSSFVAMLLKAGGLFDSVGKRNVNSHEFSPRDVYSLNIFDDNWPSAASTPQCFVAGGHGCQVVGSKTLSMPGFNSVAPHQHMGDTCGWKVENPDTC